MAWNSYVLNVALTWNWIQYLGEQNYSFLTQSTEMYIITYHRNNIKSQSMNLI